MQRQIRFLGKGARRGGFILIAAVFLMLLLSMMLLKMMSYSSEDAQRVVNDYLIEQAELAAYGATEFAMLSISGDDRNVACTQTLNIAYPSTGTKMFDVTVTVQYVWLNTAVPPGTNCDNTAVTGNTVRVTTAEQHGSAYIDVVVTSDAGLNLDEPIRFHRRTLQKL